MNDIRIAVCAGADLAAVVRLAGVIWRAHYPGIISHAQIDYMLAQMYDPAVMRQEIAAGTVYLRAIIAEETVGFGSVGMLNNLEAKLHKLYVHPNAQRRGVGTALLRRCESIARAWNAAELVLNVNKRNTAAIATYQKNGFVQRESVTVDIGSEFVMDDYVMAKPLRA